MSEFFDKMCPYYMLYGMTYDEFWEGDIWMAPIYKKYYELKIEEHNQFLHLAGQYNMLAYAATQDKKNKYPKQPFPITPSEAKRRKEAEQNNAPDMFKRMAEEMNKRRRRGRSR